MKEKNMEIVKSEDFYGVKCDIYIDDEEDMFMTSTQLGECLGYKCPRESISKLINRNERLKNPMFSAEVKLTSTDGKEYLTRVFTEDGILEAAMLSKTEQSDIFRDFIREVLKSVRKNGMFIGEKTLRKFLDNPKLIIGAFQELDKKNQEVKEKNRLLEIEKENNNKLSDENLKLLNDIELYKEDVKFLNNLRSCKGKFTVSEIAAEYGITPQQMNLVLYGLGLQRNVNKSWILCSDFLGHGLTINSVVYYDKNGKVTRHNAYSSKTNMFFTPKGRYIIYRILDRIGIHPVCELKLGDLSSEYMLKKIYIEAQKMKKNQLDDSILKCVMDVRKQMVKEDKKENMMEGFYI